MSDPADAIMAAIHSVVSDPKGAIRIGGVLVGSCSNKESSGLQVVNKQANNQSR